MILLIASFILIALLTPSLSAQGLFFTGNEKTIAERSSLTLPSSSGKAVAVSEYGFEVDVRNHNLGSPGNIFYLENTEGKEAYTLNVSFDKYIDKVTFTLAKNGERNLFSADFTSTEVREKSLPVSFGINYDTGELSFSISGRNTSVNLPEIKGGKFAPQLFFGMTRNMVECACFSIRNLNILSDGESVSLPLNESSGEIVHDAAGHDAGHVSNPMWLICKAYNWDKVISIYSATPAGVTFDPLRHTIYSYNADSLHCYNTLDRKLDSRELRGDSLPVLHGMCSFDTGSNRIIPYEIYNLANVWEINPESAEHRRLSEQKLRTVWHHHAQAFQRDKRGILLFGGFGNRSYSNALVRYDLNTLRWDTIPLTGDRIDPRFFASMMLTPSEDTLYIYGGKGNREGRQEAGIKYYYDLYEVDLRNNKVKKLWEQTTPDFDRVPTRRLIPSADGRHFYTMAYAEYRPHSSLQLYRVDMATGEQTAVGDSIPLISEEILTNVSLYDDPDLERIYCVVQEYQKYGQNLTTVYSICTPPVSASELMAADSIPTPLLRRWWVWVIIGCVLLFIPLLLFRKKMAKTHVTVGTRRGASTASSASATSSESAASSTSSIDEIKIIDEIKEDEEKEFILRDETNRIELFGPFRVTDNQGHDITYMFSPKLKNLFLYILLNTVAGEGISSSSLTTVFWPDKDTDKAKNLRNVSLNKLRKILADIEGVDLVYDQGLFKMVLTRPEQCDISYMWQLSDGLHKTRPDNTAVKRLCGILLRGKFLTGNDDPIFDYYKSAVETYAVAFLEQAIKESHKTLRQRATRRLCRALLIIDPLSETALHHGIASYRKSGKTDEALAFYQSFAIEYKKLTGEDYPKPYSEI